MFGTRGGKLKGVNLDKTSPIVRYRTYMKPCGVKVKRINTQGNGILPYDVVNIIFRLSPSP